VKNKGWHPEAGAEKNTFARCARKRFATAEKHNTLVRQSAVRNGQTCGKGKSVIRLRLIRAKTPAAQKPESMALNTAHLLAAKPCSIRLC
jgi:hypothetical protein